jgi:hypothetical protein
MEDQYFWQASKCKPEQVGWVSGAEVMKRSDIKVGDKVEWDYLTDKWRGTFLVRRGVVLQIKGNNIEVDQQGSTDWWWWPTIKDSARIVTDLDLLEQNGS